MGNLSGVVAFLLICVLLAGCSAPGAAKTPAPKMSVTAPSAPIEATSKNPRTTTGSTASIPVTISEAKLLAASLVFGECPRWHDNKLWFSDMHAHQVMTVDLEGKLEKIVEVPGQPGGLGWLPDGRLLVVSMTDKKLLRLDPGGLAQVADLSQMASGMCNDMVVDAQGRAYVGNYGLNTDWQQFMVGPAEIVMVAPNGEMRVVATNLIMPNGAVITPDGRTLIVAETQRSCLTAFNIEADGSLTGKRIWAELLGTGIYPDGICRDVEGAIWAASVPTM